jgi:hypothetical protein
VSFAKCCMTHRGHFHTLGAAYTPDFTRSTDSLPTWVPDWRFKTSMLETISTRRGNLYTACKDNRGAKTSYSGQFLCVNMLALQTLRCLASKAYCLITDETLSQL